DGVMSFFGGYLGAFGVTGASCTTNANCSGGMVCDTTRHLCVAPSDADLWSVRKAESCVYTQEVVGTRQGDITSTNANYKVYYFDDPNTYVHTIADTCVDPNEALPCPVSGSWFNTLTRNGIALSDWVLGWLKVSGKPWADNVQGPYPY